MKMEVRATVNGRRVRLEDVADEMMKWIFADLERKTREVAAQVVCTSHGQRATLKVEPGNPCAFTIEGCCQELADRVKQKLELQVK